MSSKVTLQSRIRSFLEREPDPDPQYIASFIWEARLLLKESLAAIERLQELASPAWPEECDD